MYREQLQDIAAETIHNAVKLATNNKLIHNSIVNTKKYNFNELKIDPKTPSYDKTIIDVTYEDTADRGEQLLKLGLNPVILNLASDSKAGGGWENGALAQEEALFFRSTYHLGLTQRYYPIRDNECIYTPDICFFRANQFKKFAILKDNHFFLSAIAMPAIRHPKLINGKYNATDQQVMQEKIEAIFLTAIKHKHDALVLGALGAGVYANPPAEVAKIFKEYVAKYKKYFKHISFAIIDPPGRDNVVRTNNFNIFKQVLLS